MKLNAIIYDEMGVNLDIITLLNDPTIKNIAYEIENNVILDLNSVIELSHDREYYPLTENQMGIYYECIQSDDVPQYNIPSIIRFGSEIDANKLKEAIIKVIDSYPFLKTRIVSQKGKVMLKRNDSIDVDEIPIDLKSILLLMKPYCFLMFTILFQTENHWAICSQILQTLIRE